MFFTLVHVCCYDIHEEESGPGMPYKTYTQDQMKDSFVSSCFDTDAVARCSAMVTEAGCGPTFLWAFPLRSQPAECHMLHL